MACSEKTEEIIGVLDGLHADFALAPLGGEPSCREDLHPFNPEAHLKEGDIFRYRPLGSPITHFAKVLKYDRAIATLFTLRAMASRLVSQNLNKFLDIYYDEKDEWQMTQGDTRDLIITRLFDAPRELVWKAWTEPERVMHWWGPKGFTSPVSRIDLRVGGEYQSCMRSPDGKDYWSKGIFREIVAFERLVMTDSFADEKGNTVPASYYGMSKYFPLELLITVILEDHDGKTKLTLRHTGMPPGPDSEGAEQGWNESFDKLAKYLETEKSIISGKNVPKFELPSDLEVVITRIFDAPRDMVFKASTDPDLIPQWWGPKRFATTVEKMDVLPGGVWRFIQRDQDGNKYAFNGVYRQIVPPEREVHTFEFEGMPGHVILETSKFEEFEGKTKLTVTDLFQSVEDRDGMFNSGMKEGATESMDRLEEIVLKTLKV